MGNIRVAIVGIGNCASALIQGIHYYRTPENSSAPGLLRKEIGGYGPGDISVVAALDIDERKVGRDLGEAVFAQPNCTAVFNKDIPASGVIVHMGRILDGVSEHMTSAGDECGFAPARAPEPTKDEVVALFNRSKVDILLNYLPVGAVAATRFYAECALEAGAGFVNNIPVFIASDPQWAARFAEKRLPVVGDDIKSQIGATIIHRALGRLFKQRGVTLDRTYQLNVGGNTDFRNMLNRDRLQYKKTSKTEAVQASLTAPLAAADIHIGPSDYVPWLKDNKVCHIRMEGRTFGNVPMTLDLKLSVEDSPNSAGVVIDAIRCCRLALDRGIGGPLEAACAAFMKHPPVYHDDETAFRMTEAFIAQNDKTQP
ncbi:MAG: inositol-3-phosphate synthase [Pseudomonadota bacterium]